MPVDNGGGLVGMDERFVPHDKVDRARVSNGSVVTLRAHDDPLASLDVERGCHGDSRRFGGVGQEFAQQSVRADEAQVSR